MSNKPNNQQLSNQQRQQQSQQTQATQQDKATATPATDSTKPSNSTEQLQATEASGQATQATDSTQAQATADNTTVTQTQASTTAPSTTATEVKMPQAAEVAKEAETQKPSRPHAPVVSQVRVAAEDESLEVLLEAAQDSSVAILAERLSHYNERLSSRTQMPMVDVANTMVGLYNQLVNVFNSEGSDVAFRQRWGVVLKVFQKYQNDGLALTRVYRGVAHWPKGQEEYRHFQSLVNLIYFVNENGTEKIHREISLIKASSLLSTLGRGRLAALFS